MTNPLSTEDLRVLEGDDNIKVRLLVQWTRDMAQEHLLYYVRHLSQKYFRTPTHPEMPVKLWRAMQEGPKTMLEEEVRMVETLSELCQGWWRYLGTPVEPAQFVSLDEWRQEYGIQSKWM